MLSYFQAIVFGLIQGVTELFPISSLGHTVLLPAFFGWHNVVTWQSQPESAYLAFVVGLHVATALALLVYFRRDWVRIIRGMLASIRSRSIDTPEARIGWLLVVGTIPVGIVGLAFEHELRTLFAKPLASGIFLFANGFILLGAERLRRLAASRELVAAGHLGPSVPLDGTAIGGGADPTLHGRGAGDVSPIERTGPDSGARRGLGTLSFREALAIGSGQILALFAGISRSGVTMATGLFRGLDHEDAARFSFLLATPVILAAGLLKLPDAFGPLGQGIRGQMLVGSIAAGLAAFVAVRWLVRYFTTRTLTPFGVYCLLVGAVAIVRFH